MCVSVCVCECECVCVCACACACVRACVCVCVCVCVCSHSKKYMDKEVYQSLLQFHNLKPIRLTLHHAYNLFMP